jgi:hypothetical protein
VLVELGKVGSQKVMGGGAWRMSIHIRCGRGRDWGQVLGRGPQPTNHLNHHDPYLTNSPYTNLVFPHCTILIQFQQLNSTLTPYT